MISIRETKDETEFESTLNPNQYNRHDKTDSAMTKKKKKERSPIKSDEQNQHTMFTILIFERFLVPYTRDMRKTALKPDFSMS